jgi:hypothetical protein
MPLIGKEPARIEAGVVTDDREANGKSWNARIDGFIETLSKTGRKITRKHIWMVAGYKSRTEFERFQRCDPRTTKSAAASFQRVLSMKPEEFIQALDRKTAK